MIDIGRILGEAMGIVGPAPSGDPAALHACAAKYRHLSERVHEQRARVAQGHAKLQFEGPAAQQFAARIRSRMANLEREVHELAELAAYLDRAAGQLAADQHAHRVRLERTKGGLLAQAERAARLFADAARSTTSRR